MPLDPQPPLRLESIRPLVRYVDREQAVVEIHFTLAPWVPTPSAPPPPSVVQVRVEIQGNDGFNDEQEQEAPLAGLCGMVRLEVVYPRRWWPAGLGEQALYMLKVSLLADGQAVDSIATTIGLTSVRSTTPSGFSSILLVNGQECAIRQVVLIDRIDEQQVLPAAGDSLLVVRDHYGPDVLYDAADRAGVLLVQCVPIHPRAQPEQEMPRQVARLAAHPSLVGWCVGHLGHLSKSIERRLRSLDPTHNVFVDVPREWVA